MTSYIKYIPSLFSDCSAVDGHTLAFSCPSPDKNGHYRCIRPTDLCNNIDDCAKGEDEDKTVCMFYKMVSKKADMEE